MVRQLKQPRNNVWKLAEAKNRFSEVVNRSLSEGRQEIHRRDDVVFVISQAELNEVEAGSDTQPSFVEHLLSMPEWDEDGGPSLTDIILEARAGDYDK